MSSPAFPKEYNVIDLNAPTDTQWEQLADQTLAPTALKLELNGEQSQRLDRVARDSGKTVDEYVQKLVIEHLSTAVGAAVITGPSWAKNKIEAPSNLNRLNILNNEKID